MSDHEKPTHVMLNNKRTGTTGEDLATTYLITNGYRILDRNWRYSRAEVDIISKIDEILVFVEVKTRSYTWYGQPEEFVSPKQANLIARVANVYMERIGHEWEIRFDIISVVLHPDGSHRIKHIKDAFFPGLM